MLNKLKEFIWNKMLHTSNIGFIKYCVHIKRKVNLIVADIWLLHYHISQQAQQISMIKLENLLYPSTEQAMDKIYYINIEIYIFNMWLQFDTD